MINSSIEIGDEIKWESNTDRIAGVKRMHRGIVRGMRPGYLNVDGEWRQRGDMMYVFKVPSKKEPR